MNQENLTIFKSIIKVAATHADRLAMAMKHIQKILPLTTEKLENLSDEELSFLDVISGRFAKLQDLMGTKIFPLLLDLMQESTHGMSAIDRLNKLENLNLLPDASTWIEMRNTRNMATYEYPNDSATMLNNLEKIIEDAQHLLSYWNNLEKDIACTITQFKQLQKQ